MISAINSFSALNTNTQIIASASDADPVQQIQRITRRSAANNEEIPSLGQDSNANKPVEDRITLLGEKRVSSGKAYGMDANELRRQGLKNKISTEEEETPELDVMGEEANQTEVDESGNTEKSAEKPDKNTGEEELTEEQKQEVEKLKQRDTEVRTHEQAHLAAAGSLAQGGASYEYQRGPDGNNYAVGGEVSIDTSPASTPQETIAKMQKVKAAALAPAEPSGQDRSVAASAMQQIAKATQELHAPSEESEDSVNNENNGDNAIAETSSEDKDLQTVEEIQEQQVSEAISGQTSQKTIESGIVEPQNNNSISDNTPAPKAKLSIQQFAARAAYGISA